VTLPATRIYAEAYNRGADFYSFLKTLETYKNTVDQGTTFVLTTDSEYYTFFNDPGAGAK